MNLGLPHVIIRRRCRRIRTRRLALRTRLARCRSTDLGIWRETTQGPLEEHRRHWGSGQDQGREDQTHAALLHRLAGHAVAGGTIEQESVDQRRRSARCRDTMYSEIEIIAASQEEDRHYWRCSQRHHRDASHRCVKTLRILALCRLSKQHHSHVRRGNRTIW